MIETPCVNICTLDARAGRCLGCGRTVDEITRWSRMECFRACAGDGRAAHSFGARQFNLNSHGIGMTP